jgi:hypothetical protein
VREQPGTRKRSRVLAALGLVSLWWLLLSSPADAQLAPVCGEKPPEGPAEDIAWANLSLAEGELTTLPFGRSKNTDTFEIQLDVSGCSFRPGPLDVIARIFRRGAAAIPRENVSVEAMAEREFVILSVTIDPSGFDPGGYTGEVVFVDPTVNRFELPLTAEFQFDNWILLVISLFGLVLPLGTFLVWSSGALTFERSEWPKWLAKILIAVGAGGAAFYAAYWQNPTWGADGWDFILLAGVVLTAYMSALTSGAALSGRTRSSTEPAPAALAGGEEGGHIR